MANWSAATGTQEACKRAGGRRHFNAVRQFRALHRRMKIVESLRVQGSFAERGVQARLARQLGVSEATISRDIAAILKISAPCPTCGALAYSEVSQNDTK